jgi:hypothetical protein
MYEGHGARASQRDPIPERGIGVGILLKGLAVLQIAGFPDPVSPGAVGLVPTARSVPGCSVSSSSVNPPPLRYRERRDPGWVANLARAGQSSSTWVGPSASALASIVALLLALCPAVFRPAVWRKSGLIVT